MEATGYGFAQSEGDRANEHLAADRAASEDVDSDTEDLEKEIKQLNDSVRKFLASHSGNGAASRTTTRTRVARGPRKPAKPRGDITARLAKVNQAFLSGDYARALELAFEVIRINAETHQAWTALASIFREQGEVGKAVTAMRYAAHLRPKDVSGWFQCANFALENLEVDKSGMLENAKLCYSAIIRAEPAHIEARLQKADICERQGHMGIAINEYKIILKLKPRDLETVRRLAEVYIDNKYDEGAVAYGISSYREIFEHLMQTSLSHDLQEQWYDVGIYIELFVSIERYREAIGELKRLSRWLLGRRDQTIWDAWQDDDREWDLDNERRLLVPGFDLQLYDPAVHGNGLPLEFRLRLAIYRLRLKETTEGLRHLSVFEPSQPYTTTMASESPFLLFDVAMELSQSSQELLAIQYLEILKDCSEWPDAAVLLLLGRCNLAVGESAAAEEHFLAVIEADAENVDARIYLADMYEKAKEENEALILAAEAMALRDAGQHTHIVDKPYGNIRFKHTNLTRIEDQTKAATSNSTSEFSVPRRYRPKRLAGDDQRARDDQAKALKLAQKYEEVCTLKTKIRDGDTTLVPLWLETSSSLVAELRSFGRFFSWDKHLRSLASRSINRPNNDDDLAETPLSKMYERLSSRSESFSYIIVWNSMKANHYQFRCRICHES